jgi:hypothetical protein
MPDQEWLWVTQGDAKFHIRPLLFDSEQQAQEHARVWGDQARVAPYVDASAPGGM